MARKSNASKSRKSTTDGWINIMSGVGDVNKDKRVNANPVYNTRSQKTFEELYASDDLARKIVDRIPKDGTRSWVKFQNIDKEVENKLDQELRRLNVKSMFQKAWIFARLYGGSGLFINFGERLNGKIEEQLKEPVDTNKIREIRSLTLFNRYELVRGTQIEDDITSPNFGMPKSYLLQPQTTNTSLIEIDESRIIRFDGISLPTKLFERNDYWHDSILNSTFNSLSNYNQVHDTMAGTLLDFRIAVIKMKNLNQIIASGIEGQKKIQAKLELIKLQKSTMSMMGFDSEDEFEYMTHSVSGIDKLVEKANERLVSGSGYPHTILLGESPSGLQSSGQSEIRDYYDSVGQEQEKVLRPPLDMIFKYILLSKTGPTRGIIPPGFNYTFEPLWKISDPERAKMELDVAKKDEVYFNMGVLTENEIALSRYGGDDFSQDTKINDERMEMMLQEEENFTESDQEVEEDQVEDE